MKLKINIETEFPVDDKGGVSIVKSAKMFVDDEEIKNVKYIHQSSTCDGNDYVSIEVPEGAIN